MGRWDENHPLDNPCYPSPWSGGAAPGSGSTHNGSPLLTVSRKALCSRASPPSRRRRRRHRPRRRPRHSPGTVSAVLESLFPLDLQRDALIQSLAWARHAACAGSLDHFATPPDTRGLSPSRLLAERDAYRARVARAVAICATCPVVAECLRYALDHGEQGGVWGGKSVGQRQRITRLRERARRDDDN